MEQPAAAARRQPRKLAIKPATTVAAAFTAVASHGLGFFSVTAAGHSRCRGRCATRRRTGHQCRPRAQRPPMTAAHRHPRRLVAPRGFKLVCEPRAVEASTTIQGCPVPKRDEKKKAPCSFYSADALGPPADPSVVRTARPARPAQTRQCSGVQRDAEQPVEAS